MPEGSRPAAGITVYFPGFRFETGSGRLWRDSDEEIPLRPKTASVLGFLLANAGATVSKQELLDAVWPGGFVSDAVLTVSVTELRQALGDDPRQPGYIATVHRRGYRFLPPVSSIPQPSDEDRCGDLGGVFVGRESELTLLDDWWQLARRSQRQVGFVAAPAGVGKTSLVDVFVDRVVERGGASVGRGQCVEHFGEGEAYLPLLDALSDLCHGPDGYRVRDVLRSHAPTWLSQLPGFVEPAEIEAMRTPASGMSVARMLRELGVALELLAADRPLVLVLEDLHHGDRSTAELLAYVAQRRGAARLMIVGTYRPAELVARSHPLREVVGDLRAHGRCKFLALELFARPAVEEYLTQRVAPGRPSPTLVDDVHQRTDGNALFMKTVVDHLIANELLAEVGGGVRSLERLDRLGIPDSLGEFIERQLDALAAGDRQLLEVAAAVGMDFSAEAVLAGAGNDRPDLELTEVEARFARLARDTALLAARDVAEWPDGTVTAQFRFHHALYREALYGHVEPTRRIAMHRRIGARLALAHAGHETQIAAELAEHFDRGRDYPQATRYLVFAAENALRRIAHREALEYADRGVQLLGRTEPTPERSAIELQLLMAQTVARFTLEGYGAPGLDVAYRRARQLCAEVDDPTLLGPVLYGLWTIASLQTNIGELVELSGELDQLARRFGDPVLRLQAHHTAAHNHTVTGSPADALPRVERCLELYDRTQHRGLAFVYGEDPAVAANSWAAWASWLIGCPARARRHAAEACRLAHELGYPNDIWEATSNAMFLEFFCRDAVRARQHVESLLAAYHEYGLIRSMYHAKIVGEWAAVRLGEPRPPPELVPDSTYELPASSRTNPLFLSVRAETLAAGGDVAAALETVTDALTRVRATGYLLAEADLVRLRGELLLGTGPSRSTADSFGAESSFEEALEIARRHGSKSLELRAAISLARLWQVQGHRRRAHDLLAGVYRWFTEGHDSHDLQVAAALLEELG